MSHQPSRVPSPNLLPISRMIIRRRDSAIRQWSLAIITTVLVIVAPSALLSIKFRSTKPADSEHITRFVTDLQQIQDTIPALNAQLVTLQIASQSQRRAQSRVQWTALLNRLASLTDENIRIYSFNASVDSSDASQSIQVSIRIHTHSLSQARQFLVTLESSGLFDTLRMIESRRTSSAQDSPINSTISAQIIAQPASGTAP